VRGRASPVAETSADAQESSTPPLAEGDAGFNLPGGASGASCAANAAVLGTPELWVWSMAAHLSSLYPRRRISRGLEFGLAPSGEGHPTEKTKDFERGEGGTLPGDRLRKPENHEFRALGRLLFAPSECRRLRLSNPKVNRPRRGTFASTGSRIQGKFHPASRVEKIVQTTQFEKPKDATQWSTRSMAKRFGVSHMTVQRI